MSRLDPEAVPAVAKAMLELDEAFSDPESVDSLYSEVARDLHTRYGVGCAPVDSLNELLDKSFGTERGAAVLVLAAQLPARHGASAPPQPKAFVPAVPGLHTSAPLQNTPSSH